MVLGLGLMVMLEEARNGLPRNCWWRRGNNGVKEISPVLDGGIKR
jgi:hypothetical protein